MPEAQYIDARYVDPFKVPAKATCSYCNKESSILVASCMHLKVGDSVYRDPEHITYGRCPRCMRYRLVVSEIHVPTEEPTATGFWKLPVDGTSSDSGTESSDTPTTSNEDPLSSL